MQTQRPQINAPREVDEKVECDGILSSGHNHVGTCHAGEELDGKTDGADGKSDQRRLLVAIFYQHVSGGYTHE